jgi:hypothetical protein
MPVKRRTGNRRPRTGDPITVGGGGTRKRGSRRKTVVPPYCEFDDAIYVQSGGGNKKTFQHATANTRIVSLRVRINGVPYDLISFLSPGGDCRIRVYGSRGSDHDVEINDRTMRIKFDTPAKYRKQDGTRKYVEQDATNYISRIVVDAPRGWFERTDLTAQDQVLIVADTV